MLAPLAQGQTFGGTQVWKEGISSPCKTSHTSARPLPGLRKPGPPLKAKHVWLIGTKGGAAHAWLLPICKVGWQGSLEAAYLREPGEPTGPQGRAHSRGSASLEAWLPRSVGSRGRRAGPRPGLQGAGRPPRCAQLGGTHTRSPVLIPWLLRSWTMSWVRPGQSPALSTPMFPAARRRPLQTPRSTLFRSRDGRRRGCRSPAPGARQPGPHRLFRLPGCGAGGQRHLLAVRGGCATSRGAPAGAKQAPCARGSAQAPAPEAPCTLGHPHSPLPASPHTHADPPMYLRSKR